MSNEETPSEKKKLKQQYNSYLKYTGLAMQMVVTIGVAGYIGYWLDKLLGWRFPVFLLLFIIAALGGIIYGIIRSTKEE